MKRYEGGDKVKKGTYLNLTTGEFLSLSAESSALPDPATTRYLSVPIGLVLVAGPVIGLAYIIFLPLAGIGSLVMLAAHKIANVRLATPDRSSEG